MNSQHIIDVQKISILDKGVGGGSGHETTVTEARISP